jgi:phosphoacetylglucosamine mutase
MFMVHDDSDTDSSLFSIFHTIVSYLRRRSLITAFSNFKNFVNRYGHSDLNCFFLVRVNTTFQLSLHFHPCGRQERVLSITPTMSSNNNNNLGGDGTPKILEPCRSNQEILRLLKENPLPPAASSHYYDYGTAGFRYDAQLMPCVLVRVGLFVAYRSRQQQQQQQQKTGNKSSSNGEPQPQPIGLMVTASHNDESYNGVKICEPNGGMLAPDGEELVVQACNESNVAALLQMLELVDETVEVCSSTAPSAVVHIGRDTRSHSEHLTNLAIAAARAAGATVYNHGLVTTPCLHHCVLHHDYGGSGGGNSSYLPALIPRHPNEQGYYQLLAESYTSLLATQERKDPELSIVPLLVDCACGIGYVALQQLVHEIQHYGCHRRIIATNRPTSGPLNEGCGSEHVQKTISPPTWYGNPPIYNKGYCASLDGDADRIVFFSESSSPPMSTSCTASTSTARNDEEEQFVLLDGDKIACLFCNFMQSQFDTLRESSSNLLSGVITAAWPKLGVVQTAYANGASTAYLRRVLGDDYVKIAKTGVKHVHSMAHDSFDVAVYFEANGHGTVLFGGNFYAFIESAQAALQNARGDSGSSIDVASQIALERLALLPLLVNQAVGDALSDLLLVDAILQVQGQTMRDWNGLYQDLSSRQAKVRVRDRAMIQTNDNETRCLQPVSAQKALDDAVGPQGLLRRAFIRPSGTEDVVRVYAEAPTRQEADALAQQACDIIHRHCGGVGNEPPTLNSNL